MVNLQLLSFHNHLQNPSLLTNHSRISTLHPLLATCFGATIARFPSSKTTGKNVAFSCRYSSYFEMFSQRTTGEPSYALSTAAGVGGGDSMSPLKVFVGYSVYKGKAALTVEPRPPEFAYLDSGAFKVSKEGFILLQFAPAAGVRQYDWSRKQIFSLSVAEIGNLISLGPRDSCEFFHDPHKGKSEEGKVRKVLKVEPLPDGSGHFFNLSVQNKLLNVDDTIYIPITKAEHTILTSAFNFVVPYLLGWHTFANAIKPDDVSNVKENIPNEWSR